MLCSAMADSTGESPRSAAAICSETSLMGLLPAGTAGTSGASLMGLLPAGTTGTSGASLRDISICLSMVGGRPVLGWGSSVLQGIAKVGLEVLGHVRDDLQDHVQAH